MSDSEHQQTKTLTVVKRAKLPTDKIRKTHSALTDAIKAAETVESADADRGINYEGALRNIMRFNVKGTSTTEFVTWSMVKSLYNSNRKDFYLKQRDETSFSVRVNLDEKMFLMLHFEGTCRDNKFYADKVDISYKEESIASCPFH